MQRTTLLASALAFCSHFVAAQTQPAPDRQATGAQQHERFGAASWLPADCAWFSSAQGLGELLEDIIDSRSFQSVMRLPGVMMAMAELQPQLDAFAEMRAQNPVLDRALQLASEGVDREVFVYCGKEWGKLGNGLAAIYGEAMVAGWYKDAIGKPADPQSIMIKGALAHLADVHMPPTIVGLRVADQKAARQIIAAIAAFVETDPNVAAETEPPAGFRSWTATMPDGIVAIARQIRGQDFTAKDANAWAAWLAGQQFCISVGMRDDYLLLSLAHDSDHLRQLGKQPALVAEPIFRRARERQDRPLLLTYTAPCMRLSGKPSGEELIELLRPMVPDMRPDQPFFVDLAKMLDDVMGPEVAPQPYMSVTYRNDGLETLTIDQRFDNANGKKPLTVLAHAGKSPTLAHASRAEPSIAFYERWSQWAKVMAGHFETVLVPVMDPAAKEDFELARRVYFPRLAELDAIVRDVLLPAIDEHESLILLDDSFRLDLDSSAGVLDGMTLPKMACLWRVRCASVAAAVCSDQRPEDPVRTDAASR